MSRDPSSSSVEQSLQPSLIHSCATPEQVTAFPPTEEELPQAWNQARLDEISLGVPELQTQLLLLMKSHTADSMASAAAFMASGAPLCPSSLLKDLAHDTKGSAANLGLERLGFLASRFERAVMGTDPLQVQLVYAAFLAGWQQALLLIDERLAFAGHNSSETFDTPLKRQRHS